MRASLLSLLDGVIDYAGLFPPANLEMADAVNRYLRYFQGTDSWIVGRFVCPSSRLIELLDVLDRVPTAPEIPVAVIGLPNSDLDGWYETLEHDSKAMSAFVKRAGPRAAIEAYEVRIPGHNHVESCANDLRSFQDVDVFVELPWGEELDDSLAALAQTEWLAGKARTGGLTAKDYPTAAEVAHFIHGAVALDLSFKLTAGLHYPLPRVDRETGAQMHGFLNVLSACGFALEHDMSRKELEQVLLSNSTTDWKFEEKKITWRKYAITLDDIDDSRDLFWSIGSCSFQDALDGLDALGLVAGGN